jgi:hypothetical protein
MSRIVRRMSAANWVEFIVFLLLLCISTPLLGNYMAKVYGGGQAPGDRVFLPIERTVYRICGIDPDGEQRWTIYARSVLAFSLVSVLLTYAVFRLQDAPHRYAALHRDADRGHGDRDRLDVLPGARARPARRALRRSLLDGPLRKRRDHTRLATAP